MLMLYLRWPGRVLEAGEAPPMPILAFVAHQLDVSPASRDYARRDETRRTHLADLSRRFGSSRFQSHGFPRAGRVRHADRADRHPAFAACRHRHRRDATPTIAAAARDSDGDRATGAAAGGDLVHDVLAGDLGEPERAKLDALLSRRDDKARPGSHGCATALSPAPRILRLIERLGHVRALGLAASRAATIPQTALTGSPTRRRASRRSIWRNCPTGAVAILSLPASGLRKA
jgi:hypothetical protein